eukprot:gnl/MRDRNA2_/MRDRNA2_33588_c0_seq1.p1 gnl/MRDRNA2_/MRDRNA2_33588_c0~~gnl/MRDRNA2_/MRDRNA2_33588_c0_seq1.p1  ORF type:complete len:545 (+),score=110.04 gnl/MRDRNA2_/MRDRNA2_33588_c0_seq1:46-1680(+)
MDHSEECLICADIPVTGDEDARGFDICGAWEPNNGQQTYFIKKLGGERKIFEQQLGAKLVCGELVEQMHENWLQAVLTDFYADTNVTVGYVRLRWAAEHLVESQFRSNSSPNWSTVVWANRKGFQTPCPLPSRSASSMNHNLQQQQIVSGDVSPSHYSVQSVADWYGEAPKLTGDTGDGASSFALAYDRDWTPTVTNLMNTDDNEDLGSQRVTKVPSSPLKSLNESSIDCLSQQVEELKSQYEMERELRERAEFERQMMEAEQQQIREEREQLDATIRVVSAKHADALAMQYETSTASAANSCKFRFGEQSKPDIEKTQECLDRTHVRRRITSKVIVVGPSNAGKTSLVQTFVKGIFTETSTTVACDAFRRSIIVDDVEVDMIIYDTAGQERFACLTAQYFRLGDVCLLCADVGDGAAATSDAITFWTDQVRSQNSKCPMVIVGTKLDLIQSSGECSSSDFLTELACEQKLPCFATSAKSGSQVKALFHWVAERCIRLRIERDLECIEKDAAAPGMTTSVVTLQDGEADRSTMARNITCCGRGI